MVYVFDDLNTLTLSEYKSKLTGDLLLKAAQELACGYS